MAKRNRGGNSIHRGESDGNTPINKSSKKSDFISEDELKRMILADKMLSEVIIDNDNKLFPHCPICGQPYSEHYDECKMYRYIKLLNKTKNINLNQVSRLK